MRCLAHIATAGVPSQFPEAAKSRTLCRQVLLHARTNLIVYNSAIGACSAAVQWRQTLCLHEASSRGRERSRFESHTSWHYCFWSCFAPAAGIRPDLITANRLLSSCGKESRWQIAFQVTSEIVGSRVGVAFDLCSNMFIAFLHIVQLCSLSYGIPELAFRT